MTPHPRETHGLTTCCVFTLGGSLQHPSKASILLSVKGVTYAYLEGSVSAILK